MTGHRGNPGMRLRSLLFAPGDSDRKSERALASGADGVILDLEDSVAPAAKPAARAAVVLVGLTHPAGRRAVWGAAGEAASGLL